MGMQLVGRSLGCLVVVFRAKWATGGVVGQNAIGAVDAI